MNELQAERFALSSLTVYREVRRDPVIQLLIKLMSQQYPTVFDAAEDYAQMYALLSESSCKGDLTSYLYQKTLYDENSFTRQASWGEYSIMSPSLRHAATRDLTTLWRTSGINASRLKSCIAGQFNDPAISQLVEQLPDYDTLPPVKLDNWGEDIDSFADFAKHQGYGIFARYTSFLLTPDRNGEVHLEPVTHPDDITLDDLKGYERERKVIIDNTLALIDGAKANNILLYGDRGTGKSSSVKAILNAYADRGLRLVEVSKYNLKYLGTLVQMLQDNPLKFIIFTDDLSFADSDDNYTAMKAVLDGSSMKLSDNVVIYATSNRRHLVKESFAERAGDEVHLSDTLDEAASLSDRFGITVTFLSPNRKKFNEIVLLLAKDKNLELPEEELLEQANIWASRKSNFSPRCARQFIDHVHSRVTRGLPYQWVKKS